MSRENSLSIAMSKAVSIGALLCTITTAMAASPQPGAPQGVEFPVNIVTAHAQTAPAVASDAAGDHVVVWTSNLEDGDGLGVFAQLYHADGTAAGGEIPVNTTTAGDQGSSKVAMDATGDFVVVWTSADADGLGIFARRFKADGTPAGGEFPVNVSTTGDQVEPSVGMNATGRFAVAWDGPTIDGLGDGYQAVYTRLYDNTGTPVTAEVLVRPDSNIDQIEPSVAMDAAGDFGIAFVTLDNGTGAAVDLGIEAVVFDHTGTPMSFPGVDTVLSVNDTTAGDQITPSAAMDAAGIFMVAWQGPDADGLGVYVNRFSIFPDASGSTHEAGEQLVNTTTAGDQGAPSVASDAFGDFVVTWTSADASDTDVLAQVYTPDISTPGAVGFTPIGGEIAVNTTTAGGQSASAVALDAAGDMLAVWQGPDTDLDGIFGQRFARQGSLDISAALVVAPTGTVSPGSSISLTASVTNQASVSTLTGISAIDDVLTTATGVEADITVPMDATGISGSGSGWNCDTLSGNVLPCHYTPALTAGAVTPALTVTLDLSSVPGVQAFSNDVFSAQPDASIANNSAADAVTASDVPVANDGMLTVKEGSSNNAGTLTATDAKGDALTYIKITDPAHGTVTVNSNGSFSYTPTAGFLGSDSFTFRAIAGPVLESNTATISITVTQVVPVANDGVLTVSEGSSNNPGTLVATDADGDTLVFFKVTDPAHGSVTVNSNGSFSYTPAAGFSGPDSFTFRVIGGIVAESNIATISITVTQVVPVANDGVLTVSEGSSNNPGTLIATDADGDTLVFFKVTDPAHGSVTVNSNGSFSYTPAAGFSGPDSFTFRVIGGIVAESNIATISITVTQVVPVANDGVLTVSEGSSNNAGTLTATDAGGDTLTFTKLTNPAHGTVTVNSNGSFSYTPTAGYSGPDSFTFRAFAGPVLQSNTATVSITVTQVVPVANDGVLTVNEGSSNNAGTLTATDAGGDTLTFTKLTDPAHGSVTVNSNGSFSYTPAAGFSGSDSFTFRAFAGPVLQSNTGTISITVTQVAPVANNGVLTVNEGSSNNAGTLTATSPGGAALTFTKLTNPAHGTVTVNSNGSFSYTPTVGYSGPDSFTFRAFAGPVLQSNTATVSITVTQAVPVANNGVLTVNEGSSNNAGTLTATDTGGDALTFTKLTNPAHGAVIVNANGSFRYTPAAGFSGSDSFTFRAFAGPVLQSNTATVSITVTHVNHAPVAAAGTLAVDRNSSSKTGTVTAKDADGDNLTYIVVRAPGNGTVTLQSDGGFSYKPKLNFSGTDSFTFKANDGTVDSNVATVSITVAEHAPVATGGAFSMTHSTTHDGTLKAADADSGDKLSFSSSIALKHGKLVITASTGAFSYTPAKGFTGKDSFVFQVSDGDKFDTATINITVN